MENFNDISSFVKEIYSTNFLCRKGTLISLLDERTEAEDNEIINQNDWSVGLLENIYICQSIHRFWFFVTHIGWSSDTTNDIPTVTGKQCDVRTTRSSCSVNTAHHKQIKTRTVPGNSCSTIAS